MYKLMEKKDRDKYRLLKYLQSSEKQLFPTAELTEKLNLSEVKISELVDDLINDFSSNWPELQANEQLFRNNFNEVIKGPNYSVEPFFKLFIQRSILYQLARDLFYERDISFEKYAAKHNRSISTIMRLWRYLKDVFLEFDIRIIKREGIFMMDGPEEKIRYLFFTLFKDSGKKVPSLVQRYHLDYVNDSKAIPATQMKIDNLNLMLNIALTRIRKEKFIEKEMDFFYIMNKLTNEEAFYEIFAPFYAKKLPVDRLETEINFLYFFINTWSILEHKVVASASTYLTPKIISQKDFTICNNILFEVGNAHQINLNPESYFYLIANMILMLRKQAVFGSLVDLRGNFTNTDEYDAFMQKLPPSVLEQDAISTEQLFILYYPLISENQSMIKVLLMSRYGFENIKLLQKKITSFLHHSVEFVQLLQHKPDLIITDYYYENDEVPIYYITPFPRNRELERLARFIDETIET
ncbi:helix-turn-helix domain-containing protein [Vagococcus zengguangii]|uniref:helix-turn-helix domain-containing protein n=1 Tax=Vagococcus zengguangii TaxID=2571750 RepID=UPI00110979AF|nr:helix-turn-helix domain-containing protein [Vagococcus zengguangii]TLG80014.1 hypothetical protein FE258_06695 [Vagococcus zengguangii]